MSVYGLGRWPTLYREQWLRLLDIADEIRVFIATHRKELKRSPAAAKSAARKK